MSIEIQHPADQAQVNSDFVAQGKCSQAVHRRLRAFLIHLQTGTVLSGMRRRIRPGRWAFIFREAPAGPSLLYVIDRQIGRYQSVSFTVKPAPGQYQSVDIGFPLDAETVPNDFTAYGTSTGDTVTGTLNPASGTTSTTMEPAQNDGFWTIDFVGVTPSTVDMTVTDNTGAQDTSSRVLVEAS